MPEQDAARDAGVQALDPVGHGDADSAGAGGDGLIREALTLAADDDADAVRVAGRRRTQGLGLVEGGGKAGDVLLPQQGDGLGHLPRLDDGDAHRCAHGGPKGLGRKDAGAAVAEQHAVKAEGRRRAEQRSHVAGVLHPLEGEVAPAGLHLF